MTYFFACATIEVGQKGKARHTGAKASSTLALTDGPRYASLSAEHGQPGHFELNSLVDDLAVKVLGVEWPIPLRSAARLGILSDGLKAETARELRQLCNKAQARVTL